MNPFLLAGSLAAGVVRDLHIIRGLQSVTPAELYHYRKESLRRSSFFDESIAALGPLVTNLESPCKLISGKCFVVKEIEIKTSFRTGAVLVGACAGCGAPWSAGDPEDACTYCSSMRPRLLDGSLHGALSFEINNCQYHSAKIWGPLTTCRLDPALVIPTQTYFRLVAEFDRDVLGVLATLRGVEVRLMSA